MTSGERCFFDTNVLLYAFDDTQPTKQAIARKLIERLGRERKAVLSTQVLIELFHNLVRRFKVHVRGVVLEAHAAAVTVIAELVVSVTVIWPVGAVCPE